MKKFTISLLLILVVITSVNHVHAQAFDQGIRLVNGSFILANGTTPIVLSGEKGITESIGVGAKFWLTTSSEFGYRNTNIFIGGVGNYHFGKILNISNDKIDPYAGLTIGPQIANESGYGDSETLTIFQMLGQIGCRYMFSEKIGGMAQYDFGLSNATGFSFLELGVTFKLSGN